MGEVNGKPTGIAFLSGGSALQGLAGYFASSGYQASHVISVFDSGGSSGRLRDVCTGIAVGDIRKRLTAIGDRSKPAARPIINLFSSRLPSDEPTHKVRRHVEAAARGEGQLLGGLHNGACVEVAESLGKLLTTLPDGFDWCDGSVGNLILYGRYLREGDWQSALQWAHRRLAACGFVFPVSTASADLAALLANGRRIVGQAQITSETDPIESPIEDLYLQPKEANAVAADENAVAALRQARAIVYSWGSFYTSVLPSLLVDGIATAICEQNCPKVLLLNPVRDSETQGKSPADLVREIRTYAERSGSGANPAHPAVTHVVALRLPNGNSFYQPVDRNEFEALGIEVIEIESPKLPTEPQLAQVATKLRELAAA